MKIKTDQTEPENTRSLYRNQVRGGSDDLTARTAARARLAITVVFLRGRRLPAVLQNQAANTVTARRMAS
jgi:hypothetical protein